MLDNKSLDNFDNQVVKNSWNWRIIPIPATVWRSTTNTMTGNGVGICWNFLWKTREITSSVSTYFKRVLAIWNYCAVSPGRRGGLPRRFLLLHRLTFYRGLKDGFFYYPRQHFFGECLRRWVLIKSYFCLTHKMTQKTSMQQLVLVKDMSSLSFLLPHPSYWGSWP